MTRLRTARLALCLAGLSLAGCVATGREPAEVELRVAGTDVSAPFEGRRGAMITLSRAELAFGPLTICQGETAGELCDTALLEWPDAAIVDATDPEPRSVGTLEGVTGTARSYMFDLGIVSLLTRPEPLVLDAAEQLGGYSVVLEGVAAAPREGEAPRDIPFVAEVVIAQSADTEQGVPVVRRGGDEDFEQRIGPDGATLTVRMNPQTWLRSVDFVGLLEDAECAPGGEPLVCGRDLERTCADDGSTALERDCAALGQPCLHGLGCVETLRFEANSQGVASVRNDVTAGGAPTFEWRQP